MIIAQVLAAASTFVPSGTPAATIDLTTIEGTRLVQGAWRYHDARIVEVDFRSPGSDRKPSGPPNRTWDIEPHAGGKDFDDSTWEVLDPRMLDERRSSGRVCFNWYRFSATVPERIGAYDPAGATLVFDVVVDDYAEVWVNGELPRALHQSGGSLVKGWNAPNRLVLGRDVRPGQVFQLAVFGINGPISDPPANFIWIRSARLEFHSSTPPGHADTAPRIDRLHPDFDAIVPPSAVLEKISEGHRWVEGPAWNPTDGSVLFSDIPANAILRWEHDLGARVFVQPSGYFGAEAFAGREPGSNGLLFDAQNRLVICEHGERRITRLEPDGTRTVLADRYRGKRLNSPNDAAFAPNGDLCFTDPPFGLPRGFEDPQRELPFSGVYRRSSGGEITLLTRELGGPNGLAFSPDGAFLYVSNAEKERPEVLAFAVREDGTLGGFHVFFDARPWLERGPGFPDGIDVDSSGNVFVSGPGGVYVLRADGELLGILHTGRATSNGAFGEDGRVLYVTSSTALYRVALSKPEKGTRP